MAERQIKHQQLPKVVRDVFSIDLKRSERDNYIRELYSIGWTLTAIGEASGLTRERVRQLVSKTASNKSNFPLPNPPAKAEPPRPEYVEPSPAILEKLLVLQPFAQKVRSNSSAFRDEAEEYTRLVAQAHLEDGVTLYRLAMRLGVTHGALRFRLVRYGYMGTTGKSRSYKVVSVENRARGKGAQR